MTIPTITLRSGQTIPALGQGAYGLAMDPARRSEEIAALREGLDAGMTVIDTAEVYSDGESEKLVASAVRGRRDEVFIVSKVLPVNATEPATLIRSCEASLARLDTDRIDLYLLHWAPDQYPLAASTIETLQSLVVAGKVRSWGVSNFALSDLEALHEHPVGEQVASNQIIYNLRRRGAELDVLPWCADHQVMVMAYSPIEQGAMATNPILGRIGARYGATAAQVAIAWLLRQPVLSIPKAGTVAHVQENRAAADLELSPDDMAALDAAFPAPEAAVPFEML